MGTFSQWLDTPSTDPDDARRRRLLNILLAGLTVILMLLLTLMVVSRIFNAKFGDSALFPLLIGTQVGIAIIFAINRYWSGQLSSILFLLLLVAGVSFSEPQQIVNGSSMILFAIPTVIASVLLRPWASFIVAALGIIVITFIALTVLNTPPPLTINAFFIVAIAAWLSARTLERALADLRAINQELDQRVADRTRDLAEALDENQAILQGIADGVIVFTSDGLAAVANPAIVNLLGYPVEKITGSDINTLMRDDVSTNDQEVVSNILLGKDQSYPAIKLAWGNKMLSASFAPLKDDLGKITGTVAVFRDFTREAELERMKSNFVSTVSHELRTPLNAILGYADMLRETVYGPVSDDQRGALNRITVNGKRQLSIVNDLLDQAQIEAGTLTIIERPFSTSELITDVIDVLDVLARAKGLELSSHIADDVPDTLTGDRQRLHQMLINLVGNAVKFTDEGTVQLRAYRPDADHWALEISDTGHGIPKQAQDFIFDAFRQVDGTSTREHAGSGLGLSIVKQLTTLMGGDITLTSKVEKGSTFTIVLPLVPTQEEA